MEIQYHGANAVRITTKKSQIVIDPNMEIMNHPVDTKKATIALATQAIYEPKATEGLFIVSSPGEYEFEDCSIKGFATQPFQGATGDKGATMYRITSSDVTLFIMGNAYEKLTEDQQEAIGLIDVLIVPVGGNGYTLDALGAATVARVLEPKLIIPVFFAEDGVKYEISPANLELFSKEIGVQPAEVTDKLKLKQLPETLTVQPIKVS
jgi:L-ascorbate metabolism protein UlaG (beta-lactamase superfamily)